MPEGGWVRLGKRLPRKKCLNLSFELTRFDALCSPANIMQHQTRNKGSCYSLAVLSLCIFCNLFLCSRIWQISNRLTDLIITFIESGPKT